MSAIVVCLDCPHYRKGGWCSLKNMTVGALQEACDMKDKRAEARSRLEKTCPKCGRTLPVEEFALNKKTLDGRQSTCRECSAAAYAAWAEKQKTKKTNKNNTTMETTDKTTKVCRNCGRELTLDHFYTNKGKPNSICKDCKKETVKRNRKPKAAKAPKKATEQPARIAVRETLTDKQMVDLLREHGWTVTCEKYEKVEL